MQRTLVTSSDIRSIGYDSSRALLEVEFHSGGIYVYFDVPEYLYTAFMSAGSKGQFLHQYIKYNFRYQKVR